MNVKPNGSCSGILHDSISFSGVLNAYQTDKFFMDSPLSLII